jgi:hypothetical protein
VVCSIPFAHTSSSHIFNSFQVLTFYRQTTKPLISLPCHPISTSTHACFNSTPLLLLRHLQSVTNIIFPLTFRSIFKNNALHISSEDMLADILRFIPTSHQIHFTQQNTCTRCSHIWTCSAHSVFAQSCGDSTSSETAFTLFSTINHIDPLLPCTNPCCRSIGGVTQKTTVHNQPKLLLIEKPTALSHSFEFHNSNFLLSFCILLDCKGHMYALWTLPDHKYIQYRTDQCNILTYIPDDQPLMVCYIPKLTLQDSFAPDPHSLTYFHCRFPHNPPRVPRIPPMIQYSNTLYIHCSAYKTAIFLPQQNKRFVLDCVSNHTKPRSYSAS